MNNKIGIELSREEWEVIAVALKMRMLYTVTEKAKFETERLIQKIKNRLQEAAPSKS